MAILRAYKGQGTVPEEFTSIGKGEIDVQSYASDGKIWFVQYYPPQGKWDYSQGSMTSPIHGLMIL